MGYGDFIKMSTRLDRLMQKQKQYMHLKNNLTNQWMTYASHKETGIVYDLEVINSELETLAIEIKELEEKLEKS